MRVDVGEEISNPFWLVLAAREIDGLIMLFESLMLIVKGCPIISAISWSLLLLPEDKLSKLKSTSLSPGDTLIALFDIVEDPIETREAEEVFARKAAAYDDSGVTTVAVGLVALLGLGILELTFAGTGLPLPLMVVVSSVELIVAAGVPIGDKTLFKFTGTDDSPNA